LQELVAAGNGARFFDVLFCEGCISGPKMLNDLSVFARKEILANYVRERNRAVRPAEHGAALKEFAGLDLSRSFTRQNLQLRQPAADEIAAALQVMRKFAPEDQLNCGDCGYPTCREKAIAVCQGLAEAEMCLPYLIEELQATCRRLEQSHQALASAQERLVQTERLASMGQLSAGIAHEINNPLGTVLLYSHMLLKEIKGTARQADMQLIVNEATRCKNIVRGLLDFARQTRVTKAPTALPELLDEAKLLMAPKAAQAGAGITVEAAGDLPALMIDRAQIKQMLVNLIQNGIDAVAAGGRVGITARLNQGAAEIRVTDNGCGIPRENLGKLFTPFFTTKEMGKGTGLGLAIVYGIVKMHSGDILVESEVGKGTTMTISLPVGSGDAPASDTVPQNGGQKP
jgi:signal transduction histidine kinase